MSAGCKKYIFVNPRALTSLPPPQQRFLKKESLRLMLWIKASVILRVDITVEKEIERIARDQLSNGQNQIKGPRWKLRLKSGGLDII